MLQRLIVSYCEESTVKEVVAVPYFVYHLQRIVLYGSRLVAQQNVIHFPRLFESMDQEVTLHFFSLA